jgi:hypothetical protein
MCNPVLIGIGAGAAVGGIAGGKKGALLGAVGGGLGGWGYQAGLFGGGLAGTTAGGINFASNVVPILGTGPAAAGPGFLAQAFGGGGLGNFLTSPGFNIASKLIGFGVQMAGAQQQAAFQRAQIAYQQAALRNRQIAAEQDIKYRQQRLQIQKGIIGGQGARARGQLRVEAAGRGVLVDVGSEADRTEQLAGDVAFAKLVAEQETALRDRQDRLIASGLRADTALLDFQLAEGQRASVFGQAATGLQVAAGFSKFRFNPGGQLAFRT